ncbi:MAG: LLM class flavin-dependent oxidoreductase [Gammaproteobacteria bacterium]|nr:LLM class flavin-dependent oxidoreductase [Gammaproteobacteria bacterium]
MGMQVKLGIGFIEMPLSTASAFWRWVDLCEHGGIDSIWQSDRLISKRPMLECMSAMAAIAGATRQIKFGMSVASVGLREPVLLAKQCATIDMLSEGRLLPAFGIGNPLSPDWKGTGTPTEARGARTDEALDIIKALWTGETLDFDGRFYKLQGASISPLPVQKKLPFWMGGSSPAMIRRTARIGTGWLGGRETPEKAGQVIRAIKQACADAGRSIDADHYGASFNYRFGRPEEPIVSDYLERAAARFPNRDPRDSLVVGDAPALLERVREFAAQGVSKFVLRPVGADDDDILAQTRRMVDELLPAVQGLEAVG